MGRLFLGASFCANCGFVCERIERAGARRPPDGAKGLKDCPRCSVALEPVSIDDIRKEEKLLDAAVHFMRVSRANLAEGRMNTTWRNDVAGGRFMARGFCPEAFMFVKPDWFQLVHRRGLDKLPHVYIAGDNWRYSRPSIFIFDANLGWPFGDAWVSAVTYCTGGRTRKEGFLAWVDNGSRAAATKGNRIKMWAVSTTQDRAVSALNERLDMLQREAAWKAELAYRANEAQAHAAATELEDIQL